MRSGELKSDKAERRNEFLSNVATKMAHAHLLEQIAQWKDQAEPWDPNPVIDRLMRASFESAYRSAFIGVHTRRARRKCPNQSKPKYLSPLQSLCASDEASGE